MPKMYCKSNVCSFAQYLIDFNVTYNLLFKKMPIKLQPINAGAKTTNAFYNTNMYKIIYSERKS